MAGGFLKLSTDSKVDELMEANPFAFLLITQIARRARRTNAGLNKHKLEIGEALIGDFASIGLTEQTYRTAKAQLAEWKIATFRPTTKGTVAKLVDTSIYDINAETANGQKNGQATSPQRTANGRPTTNEEGKEGAEGKEPPPPAPEAGDQSGDKPEEPAAPASINAQRISTLFRKRLTTEWAPGDITTFRALKKDKLVNDENLTVLEGYYAAERAKGEDGPGRGVHRRDLSTFLNNFRSELDRARAWQETAGKPKPKPAAPNVHLQGIRIMT